MYELKVIPKSKVAKIELEGSVLKVHVTSPPAKGKANKELIDLLAGYFSVKKSDVKIVSGLKSRNKRVEILGK